jgi:HEAT repeat protein
LFAPRPYTPPDPFALDATGWDVWWAYNRDSFLSIESVYERIHPVTPGGDGASAQLAGRRAGLTHELLYGEVVRSLEHVLTKEHDVHLKRHAMLALARIGDPPAGDRSFAPLFVAELESGNRAVSECAVMALGVLGSSAAAELLGELVSDSERGRELMNESRVPVRARALAAYGLGLAAGREDSVGLAGFAVHHLIHVLEGDAERYPDLQAACVLALGMVPLEASRDTAADGPASASLESQVGHLLALFTGKRTEETVLVHTPTALARLLPGVDARLREAVVDELIRATDKRQKFSTPVRRSAILALGAIGDADGDKLDGKIRAALEAAVKSGDPMSRNFAVVALAEAGGRPGAGTGDPLEAAADVSKFLGGQLTRGKSRIKPWAGLALGMLGNGLRGEGRLLDRGGADGLLARTTETHNAADLAAFAIGEGLLGDTRAREYVVERLEKVNEDAYRGHLALALGLMGDRRSIETLTATMDACHLRPHVLEQAAIGRALLGDRELVADLVVRLTDCHCWASVYGAARALAWTGDGRAVAPLLGILNDVERRDSDRRVAAQALGWIADKDLLGWHARLSSGVNYVEAPATLTDPTGFGVLDLK